MIAANGVTLRVGKKALFENVNIKFTEGNCYGVIGANGAGKSTFLRILSGQLEPTNGDVTITEGQRLSFLEQDHFKYDAYSVMDTVIMGNARLYEVRQEKDALYAKEDFTDEDGIRASELEAEFAEMNGWDAESDAEELLNGLGVETEYHYALMSTLDGPIKVKVLLARALFGNPDILLLDEPCAQIDPASAAVLLAMLRRLNEQLGMTVLMSEHRLEDIYPAVTRVIAMESGGIAACAAPREAAAELADTSLRALLPSPVRIWDALGRVGAPPLTVAEGAECVSAAAPHKGTRISLPAPSSGETLLEARGLYFRYERKSPDVVKDMDLSLRRGEITALMGGNGAGKSTALRLLAGQLRPLCGRLRREGRAALLPQDIKPLFLDESVDEELARLCADNGLEEAGVHALRSRLGLEELGARHPFDLSGGEQQRLALCKLLALSPDILLLDEPTKGLDAAAKAELLELLRELRDAGKAIAVVSHDAEFVARCADRCGLFWDGRVISELSAPEFFSSGLFYTTAARRISRHAFENAVTEEQVLELCGREARRG